MTTKPDINSGFFIRKSQGFIKEALKEARKAAEEDEVPVGAVIVKDGKVIARAHNQREQLKDVIAHAEILAIQKAQRVLGSRHLNNCEIYVTVEPCPMCLGAILQSGLKKVVYGCEEPKFGALESRINLSQIYKPNLEIISGVCEEQCGQLMKDYFKEKRKE